MPYSYEEIRSVVIDILAGREKGRYEASQYNSLLHCVGEVFERRSPLFQQQEKLECLFSSNAKLDGQDREILSEVFWDLFRQGIITLGSNDANLEYPFFRVSSQGKRILANQHSYFFHDVSTYEQLIRNEIPNIDVVTMVYLKEAMQAFRVGCLLSSTVMLGVSTEHTFDLLIETILNNPTQAPKYQAVGKHRGALMRINTFKSVLDSQASTLSHSIKEDLDTNFAGIISIIRNFRNQSGHPSGHIIDREQCYVLLQLFIPYGRKMYQLMDHFSRPYPCAHGHVS